MVPGQAGGQAIAEVLTGRVNPSGRMPITFPADLAQTPRPTLPGLGASWGTPITIHYDEGAEVGYRWYAKQNLKPMYAFGYGLSYTTFEYTDLNVSGGDTVTVTFKVINTGKVTGADVPQLYLIEAPNEKRIRLLGFERVELGPGESRQVRLEPADLRLLARFDGKAGQWQIAAGTHRIALGKSARDLVLTGSVDLAGGCSESEFSEAAQFLMKQRTLIRTAEIRKRASPRVLKYALSTGRESEGLVFGTGTDETVRSSFRWTFRGGVGAGRDNPQSVQYRGRQNIPQRPPLPPLDRKPPALRVCR